MTNRRVDSICFLLLLVGSLVGLLAAMLSSPRPSNEASSELKIPDLAANFELPGVALPDPWFAFSATSVYRPPRISRPRFRDEVESALVEVRTSLLASSIPTELARGE